MQGGVRACMVCPKQNSQCGAKNSIRLSVMIIPCGLEVLLMHTVRTIH